MTIHEILTSGLSGVAIVISVIVFFKANRIAKQQLETQKAVASIQLRQDAEAREASAKADVTAEFRRVPGGNIHRIVLRNEGPADALDVNFKLILEPGQESPLLGEPEWPLRRLDAGAEYPLRAHPSMAWVPPARCHVSWRDPDGQERSRELMLDG